MINGLEMTIHTDCELVTIWYPDGDICADIVYGNLALDIDARDMGRLIVASPDLLAACKLALRAFENNWAIDWGILEAAIAAAEANDD